MSLLINKVNKREERRGRGEDREVKRGLKKRRGTLEFSRRELATFSLLSEDLDGIGDVAEAPLVSVVHDGREETLVSVHRHVDVDVVESLYSQI